MNKRIIVIEEISKFYLLLIYFYRWLGYKIYYIRAPYRIKKNRLFQFIQRNKAIEQIALAANISNTCGMYSDAAFDNIETIYKFLSQDRLIKKAQELYAAKETELAFKKSVINKAAKFYYLNELLRQLKDRFGSSERCYFIPSPGTERFRTSGDEGYFYLKFRRIVVKSGAGFTKEGIRFPRWVIFVSSLKWYGLYLRTYLITIAGMLWFAANFILTLNRKQFQGKNFKFAIMIVDPKKQFANKIQKVDFLLDDKQINRENTVFMSYQKLTDSQRSYMDRHGLFFVDNFDLFIYKNSLKKALIYAFFCFIYRSQDVSIFDTYLKLLVAFVRWDGFSRIYKVDNLISHCDFGLQSLCRNVLLKRHNPNAKTWYYMHSIGLDLFEGSRKDANRYYAHGFLNYDYYVVWSEIVIDFLRAHHQAVDRYISVGCLWSENTIDLSAQGSNFNYLKTIEEVKDFKKYKIVSVFDTTFSDDVTRTQANGLQFLRGIEKLLEDLPKIFVIIKKKKGKAVMSKYAPQILEFYKKLERHPRCHVASSGVESSEIIAVSDLVISFPFTSPTFESLSARKKAIYYDAVDRFRDTFYDRTPGLLCHDYDQLIARTKELLWETSDSQYQDYLDRFIKGKIEPYLDGKALTRFRKLLSDRH